MNIVLTGFMATGKTEISKAISEISKYNLVDTDDMIVEQEGITINEIFDKCGEEYFRKTETGIIDKLAELEPCIVSCGGGMAMREVNVEKMKKIGKVVLLTATPETIYSHVKDSTNRPLLNGNMNIPYIKKLMEERAPKYNAAADIVIETDGCTPSQVADKIIDSL